MSSTTSRVSLYKPAGGENVNVTTDLNNNLDKIDTNLNFRVAATATARNAISPFWAGLSVRDTDTGRTWVSNGTPPISGSWSQIPNSTSTFDGDLDLTIGKQVNIGAASTLASYAATLAASGDDYNSSRVSGDTQSRYVVKADGKTWWGPGGSTAVDTNLYRDSASVLATDDEFMIKGGNLIMTQGGQAEKNSIPSSSTTVASTSSESLLMTYTIPANDMNVGAVYKITAWGTAGVTGTPTITYRARISGLAGTTLGVNAFTASTGVAGKVWKCEYYMVCLTTGASGTVFGNLHTITGITVAGSNPVANPGQAMDGGSVITVDTTVARDLVLTAQWSASSASNTITLRGFAAERVS